MKQTRRSFSTESLQDVARILKTISHPVRLEILEVLETSEPMDVTSICSEIDSPCEMSMMSHHLAKMRDNGILVTQKNGKHVMYQLKDRNVLQIFDCMEKCDFR